MLLALSQAFNGVEEGQAWMREGRRDEKVAFPKKKIRIEDYSTKIDTLFTTKMVANWLKSIPNYDQYG